MQFLHYFAGNLTPAISTPLQAGTGTEFFSGRTIGSDSLGGDVSIGENLLRIGPPLSEAKAIGRATSRAGSVRPRAVWSLPVAFRRSTSNGWTRPCRDFRDEEQRLRASIYKAERRGNTEVSKRAGGFARPVPRRPEARHGRHGSQVGRGPVAGFGRKRSPLPNMVHLGGAPCRFTPSRGHSQLSSGVDHEHYIRPTSGSSSQTLSGPVTNAVRPDAHGWRRWSQ